MKRKLWKAHHSKTSKTSRSSDKSSPTDKDHYVYIKAHFPSHCLYILSEFIAYLKLELSRVSKYGTLWIWEA